MNIQIHFQVKSLYNPVQWGAAVRVLFQVTSFKCVPEEEDGQPEAAAGRSHVKQRDWWGRAVAGISSAKEFG